MRALISLVGWLLRATWILFVLITPLLGVWLGSSLVSYYGLRAELAAAAGVLLFPILPAWWELRSAAKWRKKLAAADPLAKKPRRALTFFERIVIRTLALNLLFLIGLLSFFPKVAFSALATRGDWFLFGNQDQTSWTIRRMVLTSASGLEWLHRLANPNPYKKKGDDEPVPDTVKPVDVSKTPYPIRRWKRDSGTSPEPPLPTKTTEPAPSEPPESEPVRTAAPSWKVGDTTWPYPAEVHPIVLAMNTEEEATVERVAQHIAAHEHDPFLRVKALHDWVVTRLRYDDDSLLPHQRKAQNAQSVFARRTAVCEGYARLLVALGQASGDHIVYVTGDVREETGEAAPIGHAWNAVEIGGSWYIIDATWDDPKVSGSSADVYRTDYLFIPPMLAIYDHRPENDRWQLLNKPLSRGEFLRQPFARPGLAGVGLELISPDHVRVEVDDALELKLANPRRLYVMAHIGARDSEQTERCGIENADPLKLTCPVGASGRYRALILTNQQESGTYRQVAALDIIKH